MKKLWLWLTEDFRHPYPNDSLLPSSFKDLGILILGGIGGLIVFYLLFIVLSIIGDVLCN